jgi:galactokinase
MNPAQRATLLFQERFGAGPRAVASAPGRVNLIGEHVDYHGGHVLPFAIRERTAAAVGPAKGRFRAVSEHGEAVDVAWPPQPGSGWSDYAAGVAVLSASDGGVMGRGCAVAIASDVPIGAGVSSSAALEVAVALAMAGWSGRSTDPRALATLAHRVETEFVGVPCGMMDQLVSAAAPPASALLIDCRTLDARPVPVPVDVVLADSGQRHDLRDDPYAKRRREGEEALRRLRAAWPQLERLVDVPLARLQSMVSILPEPLGRRVRHVVNENQRTLLAAGLLEDGDLHAFGTLVSASHVSLRDLYECSTPELDAIVEAARALPRVLGARLVGAGWGGSVLVVAEPGAGGAVAAHLRGDQTLALPSVRSVSPGEGARLEH